MAGPVDSDAPYFLVYQMGKVGSSSIAVSLRQRFGAANIKQTHDHAEAGQLIGEHRESGRPLVVITGFREPLSRCISAYFQNLTNAKNAYWFVGARDEVLRKDVDWLIADYNAKAPRHVQERVAPWLSIYERSTGIGHPAFENRDGVWRATDGCVSCIVYTLERMSDFAAAAAKDVWLKDAPLMTANESEEKWSGDLYRQFRQRFRISRKDYASTYGGLDYVGWLYGDSEIEGLAARFIAG